MSVGSCTDSADGDLTFVRQFSSENNLRCSAFYWQFAGEIKRNTRKLCRNTHTQFCKFDLERTACTVFFLEKGLEGWGREWEGSSL